MSDLATSQPQPATPSTSLDYDIESAVLTRYQEGAKQQQPSLCCPTEYESHVFCRGERMAVCDKTYQIMTDTNGPYGRDIIGISPFN